MKLNDLTYINIETKIKWRQVISCLFLILLTNTIFGQNFTQGDSDNEQTTEELLSGLGHKFVRLLNTPSEEEALKLAKEVFSPKSADEWALSFRKDFGSVEFGKIRITSGDKYSTVHVIVKVKKLNEWRNFQLVYGDETPKRSNRINIVLAAKPVTIPPGKITDPKVQAKLNDYISELNEQKGLTGSLLIAKGDQILLEGTFGMANRETGRINTPETPFNLASGGKMFTAVAVLRLVQAGKIALNDPLIKFLPDYPNKEFAQKATVAHLLSHTSGLGDYWDDEYEKSWHQISRLEQYLPFVTSKALRFEKPGSSGAYSNSGFILLGLIIEKATGEDYYAHIQKTIFDPLAMTHTGFYERHQDDLVAVGYLSLGKDKAIRTRGGLKGSSAGGAYSTTSDMFKFRTALINHRLLNKELLDVATSKQAKLDGAMDYGYGFAINDAFQNGFGHGGLGPGAATAFEIDKDTDHTFIFFSNNVNGPFSELMFTLKEVLRR